VNRSPPWRGATARHRTSCSNGPLDGRGARDGRGTLRAGGRRPEGLPSSRIGRGTSIAFSAARRRRANRRPARSSGIFKEALAKAGAEQDLASDVAAEGRFPVSRVAKVLEASRSQLHARTFAT
jgi:hypothetical protein